MSYLTREECKELLIKECFVQQIGNNYRGHRSTGFKCSIIPKLKESIYYHTSFIPSDRKDKERYFCILHNILSFDEIPKCKCGKLCNITTIEQGYSNGCCKEHSIKALYKINEQSLQAFKIDFSNILTKEEVLKFFKEKDRFASYKSAKFINKNKIFFNSLLYYTKDILPINENSVLDKKEIEERAYILINNIEEIPTCAKEGCNNKVNFSSIGTGYRTCCSYECADKGRAIKTSNTLLKKYGVRHHLLTYKRTSYSKISQELFKLVYNECDSYMRSNIFFAEEKGEVSFYDENNHTTYFYDFTIPILKFIIEFDGKYWHSLSKDKKRDSQKQKFIEELGYTLIRVDEQDYIDNKEEIVYLCLKEIKKLYPF